MITIERLNEIEFSLLKEFSSREWPTADREHYGDEKIDFTKQWFAFVARDGEVIVGYIKCMFDMGILNMDSLIIAEKYRGQGIATQLVATAEEKGKEMGGHKMRLETGSDWKAKDFYEKLGYRVRAELPDYYAHRNYVLMDKDL
ncbi:GNAT family N-acetyltransferase [Candidatus Uhrbacteria bacterium]|nr:GNAT family N-acetyltransferase [Candidatus Uhrbacteria bacterium]